MKTTLNIIPLSAIRDAWAQADARIFDTPGAYQSALVEFDNAIANGPFSYGDTDLTLVAVKRFVKEWPEYDAAVYDVLSSDDDYKCAEPCYVDLES